MTERDYAASPISDILGLRGIISGLANDLADLREGQISAADAIARAAIAKQIFNGVRLYLVAVRSIDGIGSPVKPRGNDKQALVSSSGNTHQAKPRD
jgi:hypothetical protein